MMEPKRRDGSLLIINQLLLSFNQVDKCEAENKLRKKKGGIGVMSMVSCVFLLVQNYWSLLPGLRGNYSSMVFMIDGLLIMLLYCDTMPDARWRKIAKINLEANL